LPVRIFPAAGGKTGNPRPVFPAMAHAGLFDLEAVVDLFLIGQQVFLFQDVIDLGGEIFKPLPVIIEVFLALGFKVVKHFANKIRRLFELLSVR
jgi:hypothetical protein